MNVSTGFPERKGELDIFPQITDGSVIEIVIIGTSDGLKYLAQLIEHVATIDQEGNDNPTGSRAHIHLHRDCQLGDHSCEVQISRADAKGTGESVSYTHLRAHET